MKKVKNVGIWMDHSSAHVMAYTGGPIETTIIESKFTHQEKEHSLSKSESLMHNKEQQQQAQYYKRIGEAILPFSSVILFGPTDAKVELINFLKKDHHFDEIEFEVQNTDSMTENQEHAIVNAHFSK